LTLTLDVDFISDYGYTIGAAIGVNVPITNPGENENMECIVSDWKYETALDPDTDYYEIDFGYKNYEAFGHWEHQYTSDGKYEFLIPWLDKTAAADSMGMIVCGDVWNAETVEQAVYDVPAESEDVFAFIFKNTKDPKEYAELVFAGFFQQDVDGYFYEQFDEFGESSMQFLDIDDLKDPSA
jgi:hypothetical protein